MNDPTNGGRRGRHRRRWAATGLLVGVPAIVVPYLLFAQEDSSFAQEDSQAATVDGDAYYRLVSVRSGKVLGIAGNSTAQGGRRRAADRPLRHLAGVAEQRGERFRRRHLRLPQERPRPGHLRRLRGPGRGGRPVSEISAPTPTPCSAATTSVNRP
ncbi:UNVERIFIED_CONTAM: hypothetical protein RKD50_005048 [Streptomyces canus]